MHSGSISSKPRVVYPNFRSFHPVLKLGDKTLQVRDKMRYLGVILCEKIEFIIHIDFILDLAKKIYFAY